MKKNIYTFLLIVASVFNVQSQTVHEEQIRIEKQSISLSENQRVTLSMDIVLQSNLKITSNRSATLTPILQTEGQNKLLPAVVVYGRRRAVVNERSNKTPQDAYAIVQRKRRKEQRVSYLVQIPYESWMNHSELVLNVDLCGCCNTIEKPSDEELIAQLNLVREQPNPTIAYINPPAEEIKRRSLVGKAFLDFPVNQTIIHPDYRKNPVELAKIRATIDTIRNDKYCSITGITIEGFASPEGKYSSNARLAERRAEALMKYVRNYYDFPQEVFKVNSTPEDWVGYRNFVLQSALEKKAEVIDIMDSGEKDPDIKEHRIATLIGPEAYHFLLNECYPALRHSDYTVAYTIRGFTIEETKKLLNKRPQQLSLQEIVNAAQTYEKGSEAYNHAYLTAVLMYPDDATANLNAAAMEIQKGGDLTLAKKYLTKADPKASATLNNLGVIALLEGNSDVAEAYLQQAKEAGSPEAEVNLEEVAKQRKYPETMK